MTATRAEDLHFGFERTAAALGHVNVEATIPTDGTSEAWQDILSDRPSTPAVTFARQLLARRLRQRGLRRAADELFPAVFARLARAGISKNAQRTITNLKVRMWALGDPRQTLDAVSDAEVERLAVLIVHAHGALHRELADSLGGA